MGHAFHRKQIPVGGRGVRTHGTGIKYLEVLPPAARELTPADVAAKEAERQQQAVLDEQRRLRQWNINTIVSFADRALRLWKDASDYNDQRLVEFAGWTTADFCPLPVDEDVAKAYADELTRHSSKGQLSLDEMDAILDQGFRNERVVPTEQVVEEAKKAVRYAVEKQRDGTGIEVDRLIQSLQRRSVRVKSYNIDLDSALSFVSKELSSMFGSVVAHGEAPQKERQHD